MFHKRLLFTKIGAAIGLAIFGLIIINRNWVDFYAYYVAGKALLSGRTDLYSPEFTYEKIMDYRYPPFFLLLFVPVWLLPNSIAIYLWYWLNLLSVYCSGSIINRGLKLISQTPVKIYVILSVSFIAVFKYLVVGILYGNIHLVILCLMLGAFYLVLQQKNITAALLMALAITIKVFPLVTLPYFFIQKKWKFLIAASLFILIFNLMPAFYFGFGANLNLLSDWYRHTVVESEFHETQGPLSFSLKGQIQRSFTKVNYETRINDDPYQAVNIVALDEAQTNLLWKSSAVCLLISTVLILWLSFKSKQENFSESRLNPNAFQEFGLMICAMLLVEPYTGTMYFAALLLPIASLAYSAFSEVSRTHWINKFVLALIIICNCFLPLIPGREAQRLILILGIDFYITLLLWFTLAYNLLQARNHCPNIEYESISV